MYHRSAMTTRPALITGFTGQDGTLPMMLEPDPGAAPGAIGSGAPATAPAARG